LRILHPTRKVRIQEYLRILEVPFHHSLNTNCTR